MIVDVGPLGCPVSGGHGHADLLSIQCSIFGEPCLVDAGNYCYTPEARVARSFPLDSRPQHASWWMGRASPSHPGRSGGGAARASGCASGIRHPELDFPRRRAQRVLPHRRGDASPADPVRQSRGSGSSWTTSLGTSRHQINLTFQFAPMKVTLGPNRWARAQTPGGHALWVGPFTSAPVRTALRCGELRPIRGWIAPDYGRPRARPDL